ncbi:hypothetical protein GF362_06730 [Candidatus Dojkabacteria bacterium]|nr:hypothetical protein [Candidatus Dojkabacteria bacterium]
MQPNNPQQPNQQQPNNPQQPNQQQANNPQQPKQQQPNPPTQQTPTTNQPAQSMQSSQPAQPAQQTQAPNQQAQPGASNIAGPISTPTTTQTPPQQKTPVTPGTSPATGGTAGGGLPPIKPNKPAGMGNSPTGSKPKNSNVMLIVVVLFVIIAGIGGFLGYQFMFSNQPTDENPTPTPTQMIEETQPATPDDLIPTSGDTLEETATPEVTEMEEDDSETMLDEDMTDTEAPVE